MVTALLVVSKSYLSSVAHGNLRNLIHTLYDLGGSGEVGAAVLGVTVLGAPWLAGLALGRGGRDAPVAREVRVAEEQPVKAGADRSLMRSTSPCRPQPVPSGLERDCHCTRPPPDPFHFRGASGGTVDLGLPGGCARPMRNCRT